MRKLDPKKVIDTVKEAITNFDNPTHISISRHDEVQHEVRVSWSDGSERTFRLSVMKKET